MSVKIEIPDEFQNVMVSYVACDKSTPFVVNLGNPGDWSTYGHGKTFESAYEAARRAYHSFPGGRSYDNVGNRHFPCPTEESAPKKKRKITEDEFL